MTAEEQLKELYESQKPVVIKDWEGIKDGTVYTGNGGVCISAEDIDLIANLVVERLKQGSEK